MKKFFNLSPIYMIALLLAASVFELNSIFNEIKVGFGKVFLLSHEPIILSILIILVIGLTVLSIIFRKKKTKLVSVFSALLPPISMFFALLIYSSDFILTPNNLLGMVSVIGSCLVFILCNKSDGIIVLLGVFYLNILLFLIFMTFIFLPGAFGATA